MVLGQPDGFHRPGREHAAGHTVPTATAASSRIYIDLSGRYLSWHHQRDLNLHASLVAQMPYGAKPADTPYMEAATFIETHTEPGSLVGMTGGGNVGYFIQDRTIVNMDGLINSYPYFQANKARQGSDYLYRWDWTTSSLIPTSSKSSLTAANILDRLDIIDYYGGKAIMRFLPAP